MVQNNWLQHIKRFALVRALDGFKCRPSPLGQEGCTVISQGPFNPIFCCLSKCENCQESWLSSMFVEEIDGKLQSLLACQFFETSCSSFDLICYGKLLDEALQWDLSWGHRARLSVADENQIIFCTKEDDKTFLRCMYYCFFKEIIKI